MTEKPIKIKLIGKVSYEDDLSVAQAAQVIAFLNEPVGSSTTIGTTLSPVQHTAGTPRDGEARVANPRDALELSGARTNPEKIVALAAYVLQDGSDNFTLDTVKPLFRRAREATPGNLARDLDVAIRSGWIGEADVKGELFLTAKAEGVLETGFESIRSKRTVGTKSRASGGKKASTLSKPEALEGIDEFPTSIEGVPAFHKVNPQKNKMLFGLKIAKDLGVGGLDNKGLVWITDHYGAAVASNNIVNNFRQLQKSGHANKSADGSVFRITPDGEAFLKSLSGTDK